jgi:hypothetical protein
MVTSDPLPTFLTISNINNIPTIQITQPVSTGIFNLKVAGNYQSLTASFLISLELFAN